MGSFIVNFFIKKKYLFQALNRLLGENKKKVNYASTENQQNLKILKNFLKKFEVLIIPVAIEGFYGNVENASLNFRKFTLAMHFCSFLKRNSLGN